MLLAELSSGGPMLLATVGRVGGVEESAAQLPFKGGWQALHQRQGLGIDRRSRGQRLPQLSVCHQSTLLVVG